MAVLVVALLTKQAAPAAGVPTASATLRQLPADVATSPAGPTVAATPTPVPRPPSRNPTVTPHPSFPAVPAEAGATQLIPAGPTPVRLAISLPDGWQKAGDGMYVKSNGVGPDGLSISAWHLLRVNVFPCRWAAQVYADAQLIGSAQGQAQALSSWWGQEPDMMPYWNSKLAPLASKPNPRTTQGYTAWDLDVLIPTDFDFTQCDGGQLVLWDTASGDARFSLEPGEIHRLQVVDVNGEIIVIDATSFFGTSPANAAVLQAIVDSVVIEP
jgi:hypothetical protein